MWESIRLCALGDFLATWTSKHVPVTGLHIIYVFGCFGLVSDLSKLALAWFFSCFEVGYIHREVRFSLSTKLQLSWFKMRLREFLEFEEALKEENKKKVQDLLEKFPGRLGVLLLDEAWFLMAITNITTQLPNRLLCPPVTHQRILWLWLDTRW